MAYLDGGLDLYLQDFQDASAGYNAGFGFNLGFSPHVAVEAGTKLHSHFDRIGWFAVGRLGVVVRF
jgi:hypothetical protein